MDKKEPRLTHMKHNLVFDNKLYEQYNKIALNKLFVVH